MDRLGAGPKKEEAVEQIHGLLDQLVQEQDRVVRELKQENTRLRQQIIGVKHPTVTVKTTQGSDCVAVPVRDNSRQASLLSATLSVPVPASCRAISDGSCDSKLSPRPPTTKLPSMGSESVTILGLRGIGIVAPHAPPGAINNDLPVEVLDDDRKLRACGRAGGAVVGDTASWQTPPTECLPYELSSLQLPSPSYSWVSAGSSITAYLRRREAGCVPTPQATLHSQPGLLSHGTQEAIRKLARVTDEDMDPHRRAERFEQELATRHMGILGLIFRHRLSVDAQHIENVSPLRAKVLALLSWWVFDAVIGFLIVTNAITIGIETSYAAEGECIPKSMEVLEGMFLTVFFAELCMRFYAVGARVLLSHWVKFDAILVLCGLFDMLVKVTGSNSVLDQLILMRMFRLMRLARAARLVVQFRTLWLLVQGLLLSCWPMFYTFSILCSLVYVFAVFGMEIMPQTDEYGPEYAAVVTDHFSNIGSAMLVLVQFIFLDSIGPLLQPLIRARPELCVYLFSFILLGSISLMNLVTAIMVESSLRQASEDQEAREAWEAMKRRQMAPKLRSTFNALDSDSSGALSLEDIEACPWELQQQLLHMCNMDDLREIFAMLDYDNSGLVDVDEFVNGVMRVQADKPAELIRLVKQCSDILKKVTSLDQKIQDLDGKQALTSHEVRRLIGSRVK